ncbi:MAG: hypothetical protein KKE02_24590 [Alphaproteobacteria bacterium]|nr:hypothetical protein [Alphaproteobacteria bacterium]MBU1515421.1 hypothetical protein [Alphaproteobacteria bacterium]MBU2092944.1 hypothetical protein [Alphaproteobacteria bacterium]MBU2154219.1 hypothetical protein [Alphaproteobacteria bacterium]MBU2363793.1 hypothetical protein [Alphaproteobacteria bacterium]
MLNSFRLPAVAAAVTLLAAGAAEARIFYITQSGVDAWTVMDKDGIERTPGSPVRKAWAVRVQRNILSGNPPQPGYVRTLTEYDCAAQRTRWREFTAFSRAGGLLISKVNPQPEWGPADEASDTYAAYRVVCEGVGGGSVVSADSVAKVVINLMGSWDPPPEPFAPITPVVAPVAPGAKGAVAPAKAPSAKTTPAKATPAKPVTPAAKPAPKR